MSTMGCEVCGITSSELLSCGRCGRVRYCGREHQRQDWKRRHKAECQTFEIQQSEECGRYLVASSSITAGARIFRSSQPLAAGPPMRSPAPICPACHKTIKPGKQVSCPECGLPICSRNCVKRKDNFHSECTAIKKCFNGETPFLGAVLPLRILQMKEDAPKTFNKIMEMQSHVSDLKTGSESWPEIHRTIIAPLSSEFDPYLVETICGIVLTNSFQVSTPPSDPRLSLVALFDTAFLMNHDCVGNVRLVVSQAKGMTAYASTDIPKGSPILFNYVRSLDSTVDRNKALNEFKCFTCSCNRCKDSTELGTYVGSYLCQHCKSGPGIANASSGHVCTKCQKEMSKESIARAEGIKYEAKAKMERAQKREQDLRKLIKDLSSVLFKSHGLIVELKMTLVRLMQPQEEALLKEKLRLCNEVLEVLDRLDPGLSIQRGYVLFEKHTPIVSLANLEFESVASKSPNQEPSKKLSKKLLKELEAALSMLQESERCFALEEDGFGNEDVLKQLKVVRETRAELQNYVQMVRHLAKEG